MRDSSKNTRPRVDPPTLPLSMMHRAVCNEYMACRITSIMDTECAERYLMISIRYAIVVDTCSDCMVVLRSN